MKDIIGMKKIGEVRAAHGRFSIRLGAEYAEGLVGLEEYGYALVLFHFHLAPEIGSMVLSKPYAKGPEKIGVFSTRSPVRPNGIGVSVIPLKSVDSKNGIVETWYIDAEDGTPILDIKPYIPCCERVSDAKVPSWCSHWPSNYEGNATFDWGSEFSEGF